MWGRRGGGGGGGGGGGVQDLGEIKRSSEELMLRFAGCALPGDGVAGSTVVGWITNTVRAVPIGGRRGGEGAE